MIVVPPSWFLAAKELMKQLRIRSPKSKTNLNERPRRKIQNTDSVPSRLKHSFVLPCIVLILFRLWIFRFRAIIARRSWARINVAIAQDRQIEVKHLQSLASV